MTLPPLPSEVFSVYGPIPVEMVEQLSDPDNGDPIFGFWDPFRRVIQVRAGLDATAAWLTLWHERTHSDLSEIGVKLSENQAESICNAIASARVAEMLAAHP